jgi:hypothetical protein
MAPTAAPETSSPETDRIRGSTQPHVAESIDEATLERLREAAAAGPEALSRRITELDGESDLERWLMVNASALGLSTLALGLLRDRRFLAVPVVVTSFLLQHGIQGWCPPMALFRRLGVRSRREIAAERTAAKALRGDFDGLGAGAAPADALSAAARG